MSAEQSELLAIRKLVADRKLVAAADACAKLVLKTPDDVQAWRLAAEVAMRSGQAKDAIVYLRRAVACASGDIGIQVQLAQYLVGLGRRSEALPIVDGISKRSIDHPRFLDAIGTLFTHCGQPARALPCFEQAVAAAPTDVALRYNLAMAQRMSGALADAEASLDRVLAVRPLDGEAQNARSGLRRQGRDRNHVAELESVHRRLNGGPGSVAVEFALAKELEDLGEHEHAFKYLSDGCRRYRASIQYDVGGDVEVLEELARSHTATRLEVAASEESDDRGIFIIGLPRSGTTLVERIIGSHGEVYSAGELDSFPAAAVAAVNQRHGLAGGKLGFVEQSLAIDLGAVGRAYIEATRDLAGGAARFTDKLPLNYLYAGLIHAALPRARFIALRRHPVDVCYAMYKTLFAAAYPFTYDLIDLGRYYVAWDRLMRHWEGVLGASLFTVRYEDLVSDPEVVSRALIKHCELDWQDACLRFHDNSTAVATASAVQVRRPVYLDSVGRWRSYEQQLEPLVRYLEANGVECR